MTHVWMSTDSDEFDTCLVCGGMWANTDDGHVGSNGDYATACTHNTSQCHHFEGECPNVATDWHTACHIDVNCNCLLCN